MSYTWIPLYSEIAHKLINYKSQSNKLIGMLIEMKNSGLTTISLEDKSNNGNIPLEDIDPFTFFANFNRGITDENRIKILKFIKDKWSLSSNLPDDFSGIPIMNNQSSWFISFQKDRNNNDIQNLWNLFSEVINDQIKSETFNTVLQIKNIGVANITMGLFWINPEKFIGLDKNTVEYNEIKDDLTKYNFSFEKYKEIINNIIVKYTGKKLYEISNLAWINKKKSTSNIVQSANSSINIKMHHKNFNIILYGPPGTGKTYNTINQALSIILKNENDDILLINNEEIKINEIKGILSKDNHAKEDREIIIKVFKKYRENKQIEFITFHQSYSYEEFVEGLKPTISDKQENNSSSDLVYIIENGIFKKICERAELLANEKDLIYNFDPEKIEFYKMSLGNTLKDEDYIFDYCINNNVIAIGYGKQIDFTKCKNKEEIINLYNEEIKDSSDFTIEAMNRFKLWMKIDDIVIVSSGNKKFRAIGRIIGDYYYDDNKEIRYCHFRKVDWLFKGNILDVDQILKDKVFSQQTIYQFYKVDLLIDNIKELISSKTNKKRNYFLIIDEINRGNISKIFGELITLIEEDKRLGMENELTVTLPYSKEKFGIPPNLYIIGTMNTADRSIALLDTALRRRFNFIEMMPDYDYLEDVSVGNINIKDLLMKINTRIEYLYDRDHMIGHAYFKELKYDSSLIKLRDIFKYKIIPLLQEYFYDDWEKIKLILGDSFIKEKYDDNDLKNIFGKDVDDIAGKKVFELENIDNLDENSFIKIYQ